MRILNAFPVCEGSRKVGQFKLFVLIMVLLFVTTGLSACGRNKGLTTAKAILGPRPAVEPQVAVEAYLRQYQPGPLPRLFQTTQIYDRNGALLSTLFDEGRRTWVKADHISSYLLDATVATEDASFFKNNGVDPVRIIVATLRNAKTKQVTSGASTITMQLARNLFLGPDQRYDQSMNRKLLEANLAQELTTLYTKAELLEMYLNLLNYGNRTYGPEAAAQLYFGKSADRLSVAEAALLAGIPQQPATLDPYTNFAGVKRRQRTVLDLMVRHGKLTQAAADAAYADAITLKPIPETPNPAPHFVQYVLEQLDSRLGEGYTRRAGLQIRTTLDLKMQLLAQQVITQTVVQLRPQYDLSNAALVALRPNSGEILAMVGSADFGNNAIAGQVNVTVRPRQPGSAIKPVLYATAMSDTLISPATVLWDIPVTYTIGQRQVYAPHNYDNRFHGPVTARTALANSYNVPTVKLLDGVGVGHMLASARAMGLQSLNQTDAWYGLSLTLGGGEVTLLDLTTAYHTLASNGQYFPPTALLAMTDSQQQALPLPSPAQPKQVIDPAAAFLITDILSDNQARTPAFGPESPLKLTQPAAAKTGTTSDFRDNWTLGYTRYLVAGVWAGNSDGHPMRNVSGITGAAPIWHAFMQAVLADPTLLTMLGAPAAPAAWQFHAPAGVEQRPGCAPGVSCRKGGEYFTPRWLQAAGAAGPLADSVEQAPTAPVFVQQGDKTRRAGFCVLDKGLRRAVLRMPHSFGLPTVRTQTALTQTVQVTDTQPLTTPVDTAQMVRERLGVLAWSLRYSTAVNLGRCEDLQTLVPKALAANPQQSDAGLRVLVDVAVADQAVVSDTVSAAAANLVTLPAAPNELVGLRTGSFILGGPIVNDANCPGAYIMGRVVNWQGGPVAGVHIHLRDQWGNQADALSKSGASDYGLFDFPLPSNSPQELYLTVIDGAGNLVSPTFTIAHKQGDAGNAACHHVVIQGG
ncbi:MAG: transglycosylase domain-containing protein [Caldilineaceae bacterium]